MREREQMTTYAVGMTECDGFEDLKDVFSRRVFIQSARIQLQFIYTKKDNL